MDVAQFTAKERKQARKSLLKQIDVYNKQVRKSASFPMSSPSQDLVFKGIVKITYDRGYAIQTKSLLLENTTSSAEAVEDLFDALGLRGRPSDYALEERNIMTGEIRIVETGECPLKLQLNYGPHQTCMELRLVQLKDTLAAPPLSTVKLKGGLRKSGVSGEEGGSDSDDTLNGSNPNIAVPKEEVIDHGISSVELVMEEAVQDIPPLAHDIQERLKGLSESVAVDGKPRPGLPTRRMLWDTLKPQASALVKDIRRLVDIGEFIANRHCKSPVVKLIVTLVLELITDHSRELVTVTKEMCGLKGSTRTDFNSSVSRFIHQITYISKLVGKTNDSLHAMALTGHLLEVTNPEKFQQGKLTNASYFTGSGSVSGVLLYTVVSAYLGLVRAGYEEKYDFFASLATNMLRSAQKALETIQKTDEYDMLHLHPLRSRVKDMEHKLKVAMDNLIRGVKLTSSSRSPPDAVPEMLLFGHALTMATLDFLMVAQCASLVHKVVVAGWEILQFPWVRALAEMTLETRSDTTAGTSTVVDQLSSFGSDSASSHSTSTTESNSASYGKVARPGMHVVPVEKATSERRSRVTSKHKESEEKRVGVEGDGNGRKLSFNQLGVSPQHLRIGSYDSGNEADDERALSIRTPMTGYSSPVKTDTDETYEYGASTDVESHKSTAMSSSTRASSKRNVPFEMESSRYMGYDAVKKIRFHYTVNKAIAKGAESLLLSVTQKMNSLSMVCRDGTKDKYSGIVELILGAARQIVDEVSAMEVDLQIGEKLTESLDKSKVRMENSIREVQLVTIMASNQSAPESAEMKLIAAVGHLKDICSKTVADALSTTSEHKKFLEQAEKIEKEFVSLMTGQKQSASEKSSLESHSRRNYSSTGRLTSGDESESSGLVFEDTRNAPFATGSRGWAAKEAPRVIGGTLSQLIQRLTYHRAIDSEFAETFLMTFYTFMSPDRLMDALIQRYNIEPPEDASSWEQEAFETDVLIPIRLRVVHAMRLWLSYNCEDFKDETLGKKLQTFIETVKESMPSSATRLTSIHTACGHGIAQSKLPNSKAPTPLVPMNLSSEENFDLLDVNTLELARQLTLAYADALRHITSEELLSISWVDESKHARVPYIMNFLCISTNLANLVSREVVRESITEDQASVLSYFIQTAKSCFDLRNYEAVFAIVEGLENQYVQKCSASWQMVSDHLITTYKEMKELVSADINYHKYRQSIRSVHQSPCVPRLCLILSELEAIDKDNFNLIPEMPGIINFQKRRQFAKVIQAMLRYQGIQYNLHPIEVMQKYLRNFQKSLSDEELEALTTKIETFST